MRPTLVALSLLAALALPGAALAQQPAAPAAPPAAAAPAKVGPLANTLVKPSTTTTLAVTSSAFTNNGSIPVLYTQAGQSVSPPIAWTAGPAGTKSYVILTEDGGAGNPPITHWMVFNIPATATGLPEGFSASTAPTLKADQGMNSGKKIGYLGMGPPAGSSHPYHFEVYAPDATLMLDPTMTDRTALVAAMQGHVLAAGGTPPRRTALRG